MDIARLLQLARRELSEEELAAYREKSEQILARAEARFLAKHRCAICGADTLNYSHSFTCPLRGSGF